MPDFQWGKQQLSMDVHGRDVVLCDSAEQAVQIAQSLAKALGCTVISSAGGLRGTLRDRVPKAAGDEIGRLLEALRLDEDALEWRLKDVSPLRRVLAGMVSAVLAGERTLVIELATFTAMPFDLAHIYRQLHAVHATFRIPIVAVVVDPALITSSGEFLTVMSEHGIVESGAVKDALADPQSGHLLARLESTPVPNPLAMQQRRIQRLGATTVNYSHTQIVQLPTADSIAMASGDVSS